ncbi:epoxide hydrolase family protein [Streptosporangium carneum]|uniref:Epoxide hydrolase n=1 Tax=Streptosporangium carneum TaxID=47481 RepID=A0A9W6I479_9ACTN|nr:epoxide hydrolase family protein [Streptosporangium carneum]GLK11377.1 epoxide hydrolase [Streptosporangium carneum]
MKPSRFRIAVPDEDLDDLRRRLAASRLPDDLGDGWTYGADRAYLAELLDHWRNGYDWRDHEKAVNEYAHYRVELDGQPIHYMHAPRPGATPLLLIGGWPWTFWDFAEVLPLLADFELVVPDLPGYGFSTPLRGTGVGYAETAELFHRLMTEVLGHQRYGVYGSDWGAIVGEQLAHTRPDAVVGLHTTMPFPLDAAPVSPDLWTPEEEARREAYTAWGRTGAGYFQMHVTRPQTVAYLADSPAATAAWLVEKLHDWTDHDGDFEKAYPRDRVLTTLSIYWFTNSMGSSARMYAESLRRPWQPVHDDVPVIGVPTAVAAYPKEPTAQPRRWVERYFNLQRYTVMDRGGHFPAVEDPRGLAADIAAFFTTLHGQEHTS